MPSYDIIPLASDLLDYTIQRVKQKEAEYKPVKAYIMVGDQLVEKLLYDKVKDDGKPHFPKSQAFHLCAELRRWEQDYPAGLVTREKILQSWQAWDAHAAHGNTWSLRQQVRDRVQNILKEEI